jgi:hypothetical protein
MKYTLVFLGASAAIANAFCVAPSTGAPRCNTALHLLPTQGNQLVAASSSAYEERDEHDVKVDETAAAATRFQSIAAARSFVSQIFSLPASLLHPHPAKEIPDEVLFPVTGFQYVSDKKDHCRVLPTVSNPSCRLPSSNEPVYGWYSSACRLDCASEEMYSEKPTND